jgi:hypothetical protein
MRQINFQILIQAVSGSSNVSVIAIDDFKLSSDCADIPKSMREPYIRGDINLLY